MKPKPKHASKPKAVLFDLLTALIDSWTLWDRIAGNLEDGRRWRAAYLKFTYAEGRYRAYETLIREAAEAVGLVPELGDRLVERCGELAAWPEFNEVVRALEGKSSLASSPIARKGWGGLLTFVPGSHLTPSSRLNGPASTSHIQVPTGLLSTNSASSLRTACSSPGQPTIYTVPPLSGSRCTGMTVSACRCRLMRRPRRRATAVWNHLKNC
jgi:hypothetical protein